MGKSESKVQEDLNVVKAICLGILFCSLKVEGQGVPSQLGKRWRLRQLSEACLVMALIPFYVGRALTALSLSQCPPLHVIAWRLSSNLNFGKTHTSCFWKAPYMWSLEKWNNIEIAFLYCFAFIIPIPCINLSLNNGLLNFPLDSVWIYIKSQLDNQKNDSLITLMVVFLANKDCLNFRTISFGDSQTIFTIENHFSAFFKLIMN